MVSPRITPFLMFDDQAEAALNLYASLFEGARIEHPVYYPDEMPGLGGKLMSATLDLGGQRIIAANGGPHFRFSEGFSLMVRCDTQPEIDTLWAALTDGGSEQPCGWLKDRFGLSWQIIPAHLQRLMDGSDPVRAGRVMQAMFQMKKLDISLLEAAYQG